MDAEIKVFHSGISRVDCEEESHLYDLLKIEPAIPVLQRPTPTKNETETIRPHYGKHYTPKRLPSKLKVKSVSNVRALFEEDVYSYLQQDLEQQQNYLLRKICDGSSSDQKTRKTATSLLKGDKPISRSSWQMLANINPERHNHSKQFVLWDGRCIQVNGSKGGKSKFICYHDLKNKIEKPLNSTSKLKKEAMNLTKGLLRKSLNVKFKPGPLRKKILLDASYHKYQMGNIELVRLPAPILEVKSAYGTVLEPTISSFVNNLRGKDGVIPQKLAEFAVSVLGTAHNNTAVQLNENCCITFDLNYKCKQNRLLMRRNVVEISTYQTETENNKKNATFIHDFDDLGTNTLEEDTSVPVDDVSILEIKHIVNEMLDSVHISLNQDAMYSKENNLSDSIPDDSKDIIASKDKSKRKYHELGKLDVTIINLPESSKKDYTKPCGKLFCAMGCVCESLNSNFSLKQHCGVVDCMFGCKCEVSKYKNIELLEQDSCDIIPGLLNLDNELNSHMAKEEQKFHQTVIFSGDKSILLKSRKRNWKSSKRYAEFYSKMSLKGDEKIKRVLTVDIERLRCKNIEPLCMVHNLYKCFCNGTFIETYVRNDTVINTNKFSNIEHTKALHEINTIKPLGTESSKIDSDSERKLLRPRLTKTYGKHEKDAVRHYSSHTDDEDELSVACARTIGYHGRKYSEDYYDTTNKKIIEMERNDHLLKKKMLRLINGIKSSATSELLNNSSEPLDCESLTNETSNDSSSKIINTSEDITKGTVIKTSNQTKEFNYPFANTEGKGSLKSWLETSYKAYKERLAKGIVKNCLEAPKKGKAALLSWDFILSRYRERKNVFVVCKEQPYRVFLAVDDKNPLFANCTNIDDIRFANLSKYPVIIRNLVTNATDADNVFCILRGWDHCWELIGSAVKVIEQPASDNIPEEMDFFETGNLMSKSYSSDNGDDISNNQIVEHLPSQEAKECIEIEQDTSSEKSKWFVLTVENDFTEIQFYKRGFYVTYEGIQTSINLARTSGKTVRLSARGRTDKTNNNNNAHSYGIYAIPCTIERRVFIGPYEENEPLGLEVVKNVLDSMKLKKTRGVWIHTNKVENNNVIDNPLAYLPPVSIQSETIPSANNSITPSPTPAVENDEKVQNQNKQTQEKNKTTSKQVKPIKIRRTNGFYHLLPKNIFQKIIKPDLTTKNSVLKDILLTNKENKIKTDTCPSMSSKPEVEEPQINVEEPEPGTSSAACIKPVAEIAPQIKITHVYSETKLQKKLGSMFILKPEEINKKAVHEKPAVSEEISTDIEKFLETSLICAPPQEEVLVISDTEDEVTSIKDMWIQCCNVRNFGYIRAKINEDNAGISFEFPGFKYSEFYKEDEAFNKINQVLSRKMYIPRNANLQWKVITEKQHLTSDMLTPKCLEDKKYLLTKLREQRDKKSSSSILKALSTTLANEDTTITPIPLGEITKAKKKVKKYTNKKFAARTAGAVGNTSTPKQKKELLTKLQEQREKKGSLLKPFTKTPTNEETTTTPITLSERKAKKNVKKYTNKKLLANVGKPSKTKVEQMVLINGLEEASRKLEQQSAVLWNEAITRRDEIFVSLSVPENLKSEMTEALQDILSLNEN